jgi:hypothetical protein
MTTAGSHGLIAAGETARVRIGHVNVLLVREDESDRVLRQRLLEVPPHQARDRYTGGLRLLAQRGIDRDGETNEEDGKLFAGAHDGSFR